MLIITMITDNITNIDNNNNDNHNNGDGDQRTMSNVPCWDLGALGNLSSPTLRWHQLLPISNLAGGGGRESNSMRATQKKQQAVEKQQHSFFYCYYCYYQILLCPLDPVLLILIKQLINISGCIGGVVGVVVGVHIVIGLVFRRGVLCV